MKGDFEIYNYENNGQLLLILGRCLHIVIRSAAVQPVLFRLYLLAELLQVGDDAVTQAAVHGVCYKVGRTHHPHGLFQRLTEGKGTGKKMPAVR